MKKILDPELRGRMKADAYNRMANSKFHLGESLHALKAVLQEIRPIRKAWGRVANLVQVLTYANIGMENF